MNSHDVPEARDAKKTSPRLSRRFGVHFYVKIACIVYVLVTILAFRYWDRSISLYLESVIAEVEAEGGMLDLAGLKPPVLADEDNAVWWYDLAASKDPFSSTESTPTEYEDFHEGDQQNISVRENRLSELSEIWSKIRDIPRGYDAVRQYPEISREICDLFYEMAECVYRGGHCKASDWGYIFISYKDRLVSLYFRCNNLRAVAMRVSFLMTAAGKAGRTLAALKHADSIFAMSRHVNEVYFPSQNLASAAIEYTACQTLSYIGCSLKLDTSKERLAVEAMIAYLQELDESCDVYERFMMMEWNDQYRLTQGLDFLISEHPDIKSVYPFIGIAYPLGMETLIELQAARSISFCFRCIREFDNNVYDRTKIAELKESYDGMGIYSGLAPEAIAFNIWRMAVDVSVSRKLAALALMLRLYEVDHGHLPESLEELEGKYTSKLPVDPFSPSRSGFKYVLDGDSALIYSVGENGCDDGGVLNTQQDQTVEYRPQAADLSELSELIESFRVP